MSFDLQIVPARPGLTSDAVNAALERMDKGEACPFGEPTEALRACLAEIFTHYPPMSDLPEEQLDSAIWSVDPQWVDGFLSLCMRWSTTPEQINGIIAIAHKHGLAVHNPQDETVSMPPSQAAPADGWASRLRRLFGH